MGRDCRARVVVCVVAIVAIGCGRVSFDPRAIDASADASLDATEVDASTPDAVVPTDGGETDAPGESDAPADSPETDAPSGDGGVCVAFVDDFADGVRDPAWVEWFATPPTTLEETGGQVVIGLADGFATSTFAGYGIPALDFTRRWAAAEVVEVPNDATSGQAILSIGYGGRSAQFVAESGSLIARFNDAGSVTNLMIVPHDPTAHRWWRIDATGGELRWLTSADGAAWAPLFVTSLPPDLTATRVGFAAGTYEAVTRPGVVRFAHFVLGCP